MIQKPKLLPVNVPWMISSVPRFHVAKRKDDVIESIDFIAFFKLETALLPEVADNSSVVLVKDPHPFSPSATAKSAPYRLVRVSFDAPIYSVMNDEDDFPEDQFDWSEMPIDRTLVGSVSEYSALANSYLIEMSASPNPLMFEVGCSRLLQELGADTDEYKHIILVGEDQFFNVVARGWHWQAGQPVD